MNGREWHFKTHLAFMAVLAAIPFVIAVTILSVWYVTAESEQTQRQALSAAKDISGAIDQVLSEGLTALRTLALSNAAQQGNYEVIHRQAARVSEFLPGTIIALRSAADGQQYVNTAIHWGRPLPKTTDPILLAADRLAIETNGAVVSDLYRGAATGKDFVIIEIPIKIGEKGFLLNMAIPPDVIRKVIEQSSLAKSFWLVSVVDKKSRIIARSREHDQFVGKTATKVFADNIDGESGTFYSTTLDGTDVFDAYAKSALSGWVTVAAIPQADFTSPIKQVALTMFVTFCVSLIFAIILASQYSSYVTPSVLRLRDDAALLGQGKPVATFATGIEELTKVSAALGDAAETLARDEKAKSTLIDELNHRVKNTLATVLSLAQQTFKKGGSPAEFKKDFVGRVIALSKTHNALSQSSWLNVDFAELCKSICTAMTDQASLEGPPVLMRPRAALSMGLVLHELCTNAAKHGALIDASGKIDISWTVDEQKTFHFVWLETSAHPITPPVTISFGMNYIKNSIQSDLGGHVVFDFAPNGLVVRLSFPSLTM